MERMIESAATALLENWPDPVANPIENTPAEELRRPIADP
jgi:hypothetical protein